MFPAGRLVTSVTLAALAAVAQTVPATDDRARAATLMSEGLELLRQQTPEALHQAATDYQEAEALWRRAGDASKQLEALFNLAGAHFYLHETSEAAAFLNQGLDLARTSGNRAGEATALVSLALLHDNPGDRQQAVNELAQARKIFEALGDKDAELQVVSLQGHAYESAKNFPAAIEAYERGLMLARETGNRKGEATMLLRLGEMNEMLPQREASEKAVALLAQAVPLLQADSDRSNEAVAWWGLGMMNDSLGRLDQARDSYLKALPLLPDLKNPQAAGRILLSLAIDEEKLQQPEQAVGYFERALPLLASAHDELSRYNGEMYLGKTYETLGQNRKALGAYQAAATLAHTTGDKSNEATAHLRIGTLQFNAHAWKEALTAYHEAETLFEIGGDRQGEASALAGMGGVYMSLGEYKKKLDCSLRALALVQDGKDRPAKAAALLAAGDSYNALHESKKALDYLNQALALNEQEPAGKAAALTDIGEVYYGTGNQPKALQAQNEALAIVRSFGNPAAEAKVLNDIGLSYSAMGRKAEALKAFQEDLEGARARQDIQQQSATLNNLARLHQDFGDNTQAEKLYTESLALVRQSGDRYQETHTLSALGMLYHSFGQEQQAIDTLNAALAESRSIEDRHGEAVTLNNFAIVYGDTGETQKAIEMQTSALAIFHELDNPPEIAGGLTTMGSIYQSLGLYERATGYFNQALEIQEHFGDEEGEAATLNNLGVAALNEGEAPEALRCFKRSLPLIEKLGNRAAQARLLASMAMALTDTGDLPGAIENLTHSLQIARETGDVDCEALAFHNLGFVHSRRGDPDQALTHYGRALSLWLQIRNEGSAAKALSLMAKMERSRGKLDLALSHVDEAIRLNESLRNKLASQELRASYLATAGSPYEIRIGLLMQMHREHPGCGYDAQALATSERARARSLLELLAESRTDIRQGVDPELLAQERSVERSLNAKAAEWQKLAFDSGESVKLKSEIETLTAEHERTEAQIRIKSPAYAALTQPRPLTLGEIQQQVLDPDTLLLEYSLGEERSYLWTVTPTSLSSYELPKRSQIEADAAQYFRLVTRAGENRAELDAKAEGLSATLLGPAVSELTDKRLVFVSDGKLAADVPFAALPAPASSRPLIADHEVLTEPSASAVAILRHEMTGRKLPPKVVAVIADPVFERDDDRLRRVLGIARPEASGAAHRGLPHEVLREAVRDAGPRIPRLIHTRDEAKGILALTAPEQSVALLDFKASKAAAKDPELANYRVVHFATHGFLDLAHPGLSGLALSLYDENGQPVDGFLRLNEIYNLRLPVQLVVLSACQSGQGKQVKGEGLVGLTRGFMYAGAASLVVSLWEVDDAATTELMIRFYQTLLRNDHLRPAAALRAAQRSMLAADPWNHPYYWAPFTVEGEWR